MSTALASDIHIRLNLRPGYELTPTVKLSQYDNQSHFISATLYDRKDLYDIPEDAVVTIEGTKPDGYGFSIGCTFSGSQVRAPVKEQMTAASGKIIAELRVRDAEEKILGTANFVILIEPAALGEDSVLSSSDMEALQNAESCAAQAAISEKNAADSATLSESWAAGGTGTRDGEDTNNSKYYAEQAAESKQAVDEAIVNHGYTRLYLSPDDGHLYQYRSDTDTVGFSIKDHKNLEVTFP